MNRLNETDLIKICTNIFCKYGLSFQDAELCSKVLVDADLQGINTHGVVALSRYIAGIQEGIIIPNIQPKVINENNNMICVDACGCMGMVSSNFTIQKLIDKAKLSGIAIGTIKNSNHFGIGSYYTNFGLTHNMLGLALTNTAAIAVPTNGTMSRLGTNPISFSAPSNKKLSSIIPKISKEIKINNQLSENLDLNCNFVLDMSTTVVPRGMIKKYADTGKLIPDGWAIDESGNYINDPIKILNILSKNIGGGLVPLGGKTVTQGGHKGYGLSLMIDILTGLLSGHDASYKIQDTEKAAGRSSHTFIFIYIPNFRNIEDFKNEMSELQNAMLNTPSITGTSVLYHGQKQLEQKYYQKLNGIEINNELLKQLEYLENLSI